MKPITSSQVSSSRRVSTLSSLERAGVPKGDRKSPSPYRQIGTVSEITDKTMKVDSPQFGSFIDKKTEQAVFNHAETPSKVLKVYAVNNDGFPNIEAVREFHKHFMKRNQIPFTVRNNFEGYLKGNKGIFPVYTQNKVTPIAGRSDTWYEQHILPKLKEQLKSKGYLETTKDTYSNGKFKISDLTEENMALDSEGNFLFFDPQVQRFGGVLGKRHNITLKTLNDFHE